MKLSDLFFWQRRAEKAVPIDLFRDLLGQRASATGKIVNATTAVEVATVYACLRVLGEGVAQVPLKIRQTSKNGRQNTDARAHPLYEVLGVRPNAWQTSFEYREMLVFHVGLCGGAYSFINRNTRGDITELIPFTPSQVAVQREDDHSLWYIVTAENGSTQRFPAEAIWHVKGPSWNSWMGLEVVRIAREAIGLSLAVEEQQAKMQKNGARASGVYSVEGTLSSEQYKALAAWIAANVGGIDNAGKVLLLDRNAKWLNNTMSGVDAQTIETRRLQVEEICRYFRVNPIMVGAESKNTTYASAEQMFLAHLVHTLAPWYSRLEQSIDANLLSEKDRAAGLYANFVEEGLLRGSATTTKDVILGYVNGGIMTPNEGRAKLDMNPDEDPASDELRIPANLVGAAGAKPDPEADPPAADPPPADPKKEPA